MLKTHIVSLCAMAVLTTMGQEAVRANFLTIYGSLPYSSTAPASGYSGAFVRANSISVGSGVAVVAQSSQYSNGTLLGTVGQRITPTGTMALGNLGVSTANRFSAIATETNLSGTLSGYSEMYEANGTDDGQRAVTWASGSTTPTVLALPAGDTRSAAYSINANGTTGGMVTTPSGDVPAVWSPGGAVTTLSTLGYTTTSSTSSLGQTYANVLNNSGIAAGTLQTTTAGNHAAVWNLNTGTATELGNLGVSTLGTLNQTVYAINSSGTIAGTSAAFTGAVVVGIASNNQRAVRWDTSGNITPLGNLGVTYSGGQFVSVAYGINSANSLVGQETITSSSDVRPVVWAPDGTATALGVLNYSSSNTTYGTAYSINDSGLIAGDARLYDATGSTFAFHALIWGADGVPVDLNSLIDPSSGWVLQYAYGITNDNWVSGLGTYDPDGSGPIAPYTRAFLLHLFTLGDANNDGVVDLSDLNIVLNNLGAASTLGSNGNFDGAATTDLTDLNDVLNNLGTGTPSFGATLATPEPASLAVLAFSGFLLTRRR